MPPVAKKTQNDVTISIITSVFRGEVFLEQFLLHLSEIHNPVACELIIVHNDPTAKELEILRNFRTTKLRIVHVKVEREGLYSSWNRGIKMARGKYLAIWNVDDIRTPNSLELQKKALENSTAVMCYGDFYASTKYGEHKEVFYEYNKDYQKLKKEALQRHVVGGFPMWKKEIHDKIGYFDEQFKLVADWEFQIRTALNYDLVKAEEFLGYFLADAPHKLSSNRRLQATEQTLVQIRYKIYDKILIQYLPFIRKFKLKKVLSYGNWIDLKTLIPDNSLPVSKNILNLVILPFSYSAWCINKLFFAIHKRVFKFNNGKL